MSIINSNMDQIKEFSPLFEALAEMFLPDYAGYQWLVSPSQYMTFIFWIITSITIEGPWQKWDY